MEEDVTFWGFEGGVRSEERGGRSVGGEMNRGGFHRGYDRARTDVL
jgi:hypothetical protein